MSVLQQPEVIISGIESLRTVDDGQLENKMGHAERELRDVKGEEERLLRFLVMGKISEAQFDHQQTFITEREKNLRASLDEYRNQSGLYASDQVGGADGSVCFRCTAYLSVGTPYAKSKRNQTDWYIRLDARRFCVDWRPAQVCCQGGKAETGP